MTRVVAPFVGAAGRRNEYDEENRLTAVRRASDNALVLEIKYDAIGRRVETIERVDSSCNPILPRRIRHIYDGLHVVQDCMRVNISTAGQSPIT